jgi:hypothetical protein
MRYGPQWRSHRKCFAQSLHINAVDAYHPIQTESVQKLLLSFLDSPGKFKEHINNHAGRIILKIAYDYNASSQNDYFVGLSDEFFRQASEIMLTGKIYLVDTFPFCSFFAFLLVSTVTHATRYSEKASTLGAWLQIPSTWCQI